MNSSKTPPRFRAYGGAAYPRSSEDRALVYEAKRRWFDSTRGYADSTAYRSMRVCKGSRLVIDFGPTEREKVGCPVHMPVWCIGCTTDFQSVRTGSSPVTGSRIAASMTAVRRSASLRSSVVERPFRNRLVRGSTPRVGSLSLAQLAEHRSEVPGGVVRFHGERRNNYITHR